MFVRNWHFILLMLISSFITIVCNAHDKNNDVVSLCHDADSLQKLGHYNQSIELAKEILRRADAEKDDDMKILAYSLLSINYQFMGNFYDAKQNASECLSIAKGKDDYQKIAMALKNIAYIYYQFNYTEIAERYILKAIAIEEEFNDEDNLAVSYGYAASIYSQMHHFRRGLRYAQKAYFLAKKSENDLRRAVSMCQMAENLMGMERYVEARINYMAAMNIFKNNNVTHSLAVCYYELAVIDSRMGKHDDAKRNLSSSFNLIQNMDDNILVTKVYDQINEMLAIKENQVKNHKIWLWAVWGFVLIMFSFLWYIFLMNRRLKNTSVNLRKSNDVKNRLIALISHDLRSGMLSINMAAHMLSTDNDNSEILIDELVKQSDAQGILVENLLQWSKLQVSQDSTIRKVRFQIFSAMKEVVDQMQFYANRKSIKIIIETDNDLDMESDRNIIQVVLRNIISNAIKFSNRGSSIHLSYKQIYDGAICISVRDEGIGMSPDVIDGIYNKSMLIHHAGTEQESGQGLGLALSCDMLEMIGGKIKISSEQNVGSVFTLIF